MTGRREKGKQKGIREGKGKGKEKFRKGKEKRKDFYLADSLKQSQSYSLINPQ